MPGNADGQVRKRNAASRISGGAGIVAAIIE
jgi:hypothetical protein